MWIYEPDAETLAHPKTCKCGAKILFCKTKAGKQAPINAGFKVLTREKVGGVELCQVENDASPFATCSYAKHFRRVK